MGLSLRAIVRRATSGTSYWLQEEGEVFKMDAIRASSCAPSDKNPVDIQGVFRNNMLVHNSGLHLGLNLLGKKSIGWMGIMWILMWIMLRKICPRNFEKGKEAS